MALINFHKKIPGALSKHKSLIYFKHFREQPSLFYTPLSDPTEQLCVISANICTAEMDGAAES